MAEINCAGQTTREQHQTDGPGARGSGDGAKHHAGPGCGARQRRETRGAAQAQKLFAGAVVLDTEQ